MSLVVYVYLRMRTAKFLCMKSDQLGFMVRVGLGLGLVLALRLNIG